MSQKDKQPHTVIKIGSLISELRITIHPCERHKCSDQCHECAMMLATEMKGLVLEAFQDALRKVEGLCVEVHRGDNVREKERH